MVQRTIYNHWYDEQESSRYPFGDNSTLIANTGVELDRAVFLDANLYPVGNLENLYISRIVVNLPNISVYISSTSVVDICSVTFDAFDNTLNGILQLKDKYSRPAGVLVSTELNLKLFRTWDVGTHEFVEEDTSFAASVVIPTPEEGVRGFTIKETDHISGEIWFIGERGVILRNETDATSNCKYIRVDVVGDPLWRRRECQDKTVTVGDSVFPLFGNVNYLKTINGNPPDIHGNFVFSTGDQLQQTNALHIMADSKGIKFEIVGPIASDIT